MRHVPLGPDADISEIMLGTMTFGTQTGEAEAHAQMDLAADRGVTWLDTAEMYPVNPVRAETIGLTEEIVGRWHARNPGRLKLATKHSGEGSHARGGAPISPRSIPEAVEGSLRRLRAETIDLYQFHWPNRGSFQFRQNWTYRPEGDRAAIRQDVADCEGALMREIERGTIRAFGLSNESTWGMDAWIAAAGDRPTRPVSIQNEYSLLHRLADADLTEMMVQEEVTMLAFSPLAAGLLTGKYQDGAVPEGSRRAINPRLGGRWNEALPGVIDGYLALARAHGVDPVHMALAWLQTRPFRCAAILGATTLTQLEHGLGAAGLTLPEEVVAEIDALNRARPLPY